MTRPLFSASLRDIPNEGYLFRSDDKFDLLEDDQAASQSPWWANAIAGFVVVGGLSLAVLGALSELPDPDQKSEFADGETTALSTQASVDEKSNFRRRSFDEE